MSQNTLIFAEELASIFYKQSTKINDLQTWQIKKTLKAEINVVPYIDVMLVLLIIFMVLSPLLIQGIEVNLPKTDTTKMTVQSEPLSNLNQFKEGEYFINVGDESLHY
jgi:biopolymer transport protein TolR